MITIVGIIFAIIILDIVVLAHEFGHYIMAKINKIGVDEFSIGFGKELAGFTKGETRYKLSMLPFGGYCKLRGEENRDRAKEIAPDPKAMYNRPPLARLIAIIGGPLFNYIFAVILMAILFFIGFQETYITSDITVISSGADGKPTPAFLSGLKSGDRIISINGEKVESYTDIPRIIALRIDEPLDISYLRDGITNASQITPRYNDQAGMGFIGVSPLYLPVIGLVKTNTPAFKADIRMGDRITGVDGKNIQYFYQLQEILQSKANQEVELNIVRSNETILKKVILERFEGKGYLGIAPGEVPNYQKKFKSKNIIEAFITGFNESNKLIIETIDSLKAMVKGKINLQRNMSGPVRIIQVTGDIVTKTNYDLVTITRFMALISIAIGFFQLLPFPGLDGGHIVFNTIELVSRRKFPEKIRFYIEYAGMLFIISLSIILFFNDIVNIFFGR